MSPGLDRTKQRVHFHEEHPLEEVINCSKYVLRQKPSLQQPSTAEAPAAPKVDLTKYIGMTVRCPKGIQLGPDNVLEIGETACGYETKNMPSMTAHLRKHTQTWKCGHCGKTHPNASEFHRHSAMSHGNKIPDLVKDHAAEAEFEALKGLVEANLEIEFQAEQHHHQVKKKPKLTNDAAAAAPSIVAKSTTSQS